MMFTVFVYFRTRNEVVNSSFRLFLTKPESLCRSRTTSAAPIFLLLMRVLPCPSLWRLYWMLYSETSNMVSECNLSQISRIWLVPLRFPVLESANEKPVAGQPIEKGLERVGSLISNGSASGIVSAETAIYLMSEG